MMLNVNGAHESMLDALVEAVNKRLIERARQGPTDRAAMDRVRTRVTPTNVVRCLIAYAGTQLDGSSWALGVDDILKLLDEHGAKAGRPKSAALPSQRAAGDRAMEAWGSVNVDGVHTKHVKVDLSKPAARRAAKRVADAILRNAGAGALVDEERTMRQRVVEGRKFKSVVRSRKAGSR